MRPVRALVWWFTSMMGDHDYQRFVAHLRQRHPDADIPTEREYWRRRYAETDRNPGVRCC